MQQAGVVIIGGGLAGAQVAIQLRQRKWAGPITVLSQEPVAPYWRPPLSKSVLAGTEDAERALIRPASFWERRAIALHLNTDVMSLDRSTQSIRTMSGAYFRYDFTVLATGAFCIRPKLPGMNLPGAHVLRSLADAVALRDAVLPGERVAVLGGGFLGLEAASALTARGAFVTVIERESRLLARVSGPPMSEAVLALHRAHGVCVLLGRGATAILGDAAARSVQLEDGETIPFDHLLVCVGIRPETQLAAAAGLACEDGILVDDALRTSDPAIFAVGDCARFPSRRYARSLRLESIQNAIDGAAAVAAAICGETPCYDPLPIISSLQFAHQLDFIGMVSESRETRILQTSDAAEFVALHGHAGRCIAAESLQGAPETLKKLRDIITEHAPFDTATI